VRRLIPLTVTLLALALAACAGTPHAAPAAIAAVPLLRLSPASFGREWAEQQQLQFEARGRQQSLDALLEVDAAEVRLALLAAGQPALRLQWDGRQMQETRAEWLPPALSSARVLNDLQLVFWPATEIRRVLPDGWHLQETADARQLQFSGEVVVDIRFPAAGRVELHQRREGYRLLILSPTPEGKAR